MNLKLSEKTVLITGGSSGIGKTTALTYAREEDVQIVITYRTDETSAKEVKDLIIEKNCRAITVQMDLANHKSIVRAAKVMAEEFGGIDVLVNNAVDWGSSEMRRMVFEDVPIEAWRKMININLLGTIMMIQQVVPSMRKQNFGRIVNVSSDIAHDGMRGNGPYGTMKAALSGLMSNLVTELSADNILTNTVMPGLTFTEKALKRFPNNFQKSAANAFPTERVTRPEDVASLIAYLGSGANTHVNGEVIRVTGNGSQPMLYSIFQKELAAE